MMRNLKVLLMCLLAVAAFSACGDDPEEPNNNVNNTVSDAGDTGGDAGACDDQERPTCCDTSLQSVDPQCNADTTEWECPEGSTRLPVGGVCEDQDAGGDADDAGDGGDTADGA